MPPRSSLGSFARWTMVAAWGVLATVAGAQATSASRPSEFAATIARLSEPGGYFDTDNLISNETSYLSVLGGLRQLGVRGGAYIGVGPDQNYSYVAAIRPRVAYIVDIRRDNLLEHLIFKALFKQSRNRMEFLCRWLGRVPPTDLATWDGRTISDIVAAIDRRPLGPAFARQERDAIVAAARATGVPLSAQDEATIRRYYDAFVQGGLDLQFTSFNRGPRPYYPTLRELVLAKDSDGKLSSYLAREDDWRFVKSLQASDRIIPVVGNMAGAVSMAAIGRDVRAQRLTVSAIYTSNVEQYIWRDGSFPRFADNVAALPFDSHSAIIRSYFGGGNGGQPHPLATGDSYSTQLIQPVGDFVARHKAGGWKSYWELVTAGNR